jgi:lysophospholipase L1-like esterase
VLASRFTIALLSVFTISGATTYYLVTIDKLNVFTGILFLFTGFSFVLLVAESIFKLLNASNEVGAKIRLSLLTTLLMILAGELFLRYGFGKYSNYFEQNGGRDYRSIYAEHHKTWFHIYDANVDVRVLKKEFTHFRRTNSLGLAEREINRDKSPGEVRIIALGDSFTEGMGVPYDESWVRVVENNLAAKLPNRKITTINAGVSGSDVYFEYVLLRDKLLSLSPDLVIVAVNHSDVDDIILRGGMDRFQPDGTVRNRRKGPTWEWVYGISYIFRHVIHDGFKYNWMLLSREEVMNEEQSAIEKIGLSIRQFSDLARDHHFYVLFVFHPHEMEIKQGRYEPPTFDDLVQQLKESRAVDMIDLLECYLGGEVITRENSSEFFWKTDLHHNRKGYAVMGGAIAEMISRSLSFSDKGSEHLKFQVPQNPCGRINPSSEYKWRMYVGSGNVAHVIHRATDSTVFRIAIDKAGTTNPWDIQLNQVRVAVKLGWSYILAFRAKADRSRSINAAVSKDHEPWDSLGLYRTIGLTQNWQEFELEFTATQDDPNARIHFDMGGNAAAVELSDVGLRTLGP